MKTFKLVAKLGTDPVDGLETYLVTLFDDQGTVQGASGFVKDDATDYLCQDAECFTMHLALDAVYIGAMNDKAEALIAALADAPVLWETEVPGDMEDGTDTGDNSPQAVS
jgi:hypothetical protein